MVVKRESRKFQNDKIFSNSMMSVDVRCKVGQRVDLLENKSVPCGVISLHTLYQWSFQSSKQLFQWSFQRSKQLFQWSFQRNKQLFQWSFQSSKQLFIIFSSEIKVGVWLRTWDAICNKSINKMTIISSSIQHCFLHPVFHSLYTTTWKK